MDKIEFRGFVRRRTPAQKGSGSASSFAQYNIDLTLALDGNRNLEDPQIWFDSDVSEQSNSNRDARAFPHFFHGLPAFP